MLMTKGAAPALLTDDLAESIRPHRHKLAHAAEEDSGRHPRRGVHAMHGAVAIVACSSAASRAHVASIAFAFAFACACRAAQLATAL